MVKLIYLTQTQYEAIKSLNIGSGEEVVLVAPGLVEEVRSHSIEPNRAADLYESVCDLDLFDIKAELVDNSTHNFMHFLRSESKS